jgi:hypothetical protein
VAVLEVIRMAMKSYPDIEVWGVSITSGEGWRAVRPRELHCSKVQLVSALREVLDCERLKISRLPSGSPLRGGVVLREELRRFKGRVTTAQNQTYGAEGSAHDDCVLSLSLPIWAGSLPYMSMRETEEGVVDLGLHPRERRSLAAELVAAMAGNAEREAREREEERERQRRLAEFEDMENPFWWETGMWY